MSLLKSCNVQLSDSLPRLTIGKRFKNSIKVKIFSHIVWPILIPIIVKYCFWAHILRTIRRVEYSNQCNTFQKESNSDFTYSSPFFFGRRSFNAYRQFFAIKHMAEQLKASPTRVFDYPRHAHNNDHISLTIEAFTRNGVDECEIKIGTSHFANISLSEKEEKNVDEIY